jgi:hypothetical protein
VVLRIQKTPEICGRAFQWIFVAKLSSSLFCSENWVAHFFQPSLVFQNKQQSTNTPKKLAVLMAAAVRRYNTGHIAQ